MLTKDIINEKNGFFASMQTDLAERVRDEAFNGVSYGFDSEDSCAKEFRVQIIRDRAERGSLLWRVAVCGILVSLKQNTTMASIPDTPIMRNSV